MRTYYRREILDLNKIIEYKIGDKNNLIEYIAQHFNINKNLINFELENKKTLEEIDKEYNLINNIKDKNINDNLNLNDIFIKNINIKINNEYELCITRHNLLNLFEIYKKGSFNKNTLLFFWKEE